MAEKKGGEKRGGTGKDETRTQRAMWETSPARRTGQQTWSGVCAWPAIHAATSALRGKRHPERGAEMSQGGVVGEADEEVDFRNSEDDDSQEEEMDPLSYDGHDACLAALLEDALGYAPVRHTLRQEEDRDFVATFRLAWTTEEPWESAMHSEGVPVLTLQVSNPGEDVELEDVPVLNASTIAGLPVGEPIYVCMPAEKEGPLTEAQAAIAFQASAIIAHSHAYGGSHQHLERVARVMTETLECVLRDFDSYLQNGPEKQEEGGREGVFNPYSREPWDLATGGFTVSRFLVAIVGVVRIYQEFDSTQTARK